MLISIATLSHGALADEELQRVIRAMNRQIAEDFEPYWSFGATLRLEGAAGVRPRLAARACHDAGTGQGRTVIRDLRRLIAKR